MRNKFDQQLDVLSQELTEMGALCENAISQAAGALLQGDLSLTDAAIATDAEIDQKERAIEGLCLKLLLQQQPVARDLRQVSSALKMITDMERIGDQAADISEIIRLANVTAKDNTLHIGQMAKATMKMVTESVEAYVRRDVALANAVIASDDVVDHYFDAVKRELISLIARDADKGEYAIDLMMIAKYFERIGDHAVNIAEWVVFSITGRHGDMDTPPPARA
nr:phosphate signaling complex protein PhoU [bacterium]